MYAYYERLWLTDKRQTDLDNAWSVYNSLTRIQLFWSTKLLINRSLTNWRVSILISEFTWKVNNDRGKCKHLLTQISYTEYTTWASIYLCINGNSFSLRQCLRTYFCFLKNRQYSWWEYSFYHLPINTLLSWKTV